MNHHLTVTLALAIFVATALQWLSLKIRIPALLLLLTAGAVLGDTYFRIIDLETLGAGLGPLVTLSVALILFEGALNLNLSDAAHAPRAVIRLLTFGALISTTLTTLAAHFMLGLDWAQSLLLGCILMVTGPTVVAPILRKVRVTKPLNSVLQWEGILIDPIGAIAAIVAFQIVLATHGHTAASPYEILAGYPARMAAGALIGFVGAFLLSRILSNPRLAPSKEDDMNNLLGLGVVMGLFAASEALIPESGIMTAAIAGVTLANLNPQGLTQLRLFKGQIATLLIGTLFILLASQLDLEAIFLNFNIIHLFVALIILVIRPASVLFSTMGTRLTLNERLFASFFAPRGIVAAAVAMLFGTQLAGLGIPGAEMIVDATYETILITVAVAAVAAYPMSKLLKVSAPTPSGVLIVGSHAFSRALARVLIENGVPVRLIDSNPENCRRAEAEELPSVCGSATDERILDNLGFDELGTVIALTPNEEVNTLVCEWAKETVGPRQSYQARLTSEEILSAATRTGVGGLAAFAPVLPINALSDTINKSNATINAVEDYDKRDIADSEGLSRMAPGRYLLGSITRNSFRVFSPDTRPESAKVYVVLDVFP